MEVIEIIFIFVGVFVIGFCSGRLWNLRKMLAELKDLEDQFEHVKKLSDDLDEGRVRYITELLNENKQLKLQIEMLTRADGIGVVDGENDIKLTAEDSE